MVGMIFCAGLGTRLKPLTDTMPKALLPLGGKTLLQWQVEMLRDAGITDIVINVHHFADMIIDTVRANNGWGCNILISDERDALLDTGGGLRKAWSQIINHKSQMASEPILACNVDILSNIDLRAFINHYQSPITNHQSPLGVLVVSPRDTQRYLLFDDEGILRGWTNIATGEVRPAASSANFGGFTRLAFSGMQILSPRIFDCMDPVVAAKGDRFSLIDLYMSICEQNLSPFTFHFSPLKAFLPKAFKMMDVGKIEQLDDAKCFVQQLKCTK